MVPGNAKYPPQEGYQKFQRGEQLSKAKLLKAKYEQKLEFPQEQGGEFQAKKTSVGKEIGYFLEQHNSLIAIIHSNLYIVLQT